MRRLRVGEWLTGAASVGLLAVLFLDWFDDGDGTKASGWAGLGWLMDALLALVIFGGIAVAFTTVKRSSPAMPVGSAVLTAAIGLIVVVVLALRVLVHAHGSTTVEVWAYGGLLLAALVPTGAFLTLRDERTAALESAYTPPPARPVPGS